MRFEPVTETPETRIRPQRISVGARLPAAFGGPRGIRPDQTAQTGGGSVDRLRALHLAFSGVSIVLGSRAPTYRIGGGVSEEVMLNLVVRGRRRFELGGRETEGGPGSAVVTPTPNSGAAWFEPGGRYLSLFAPDRAVRAGAPGVQLEGLRALAPTIPALKLLTSYVGGLMKEQVGVDRTSAAAIADHLVDLCALLLGAQGDAREQAELRGLRAAQRAGVIEAIRAGAAVPGFSLEIVAGQLGVAPRCVLDLLEEVGASFDAFVAARRLDVVRERLDDPAYDRMTVADLASSCGFADLKAFHRQFAARFGEPAAAVRSNRGKRRS